MPFHFYLQVAGWVEPLQGNHDVAATLFEQAVQLESGQAEIRLHAAIVYLYLASGKSDRAEVELKAALRLDPVLEGRDEVRQLRERIARLRPATPR